MKKIYRITEFFGIQEYEFVKKYDKKIAIRREEYIKTENGKVKSYIYELINENDVNSGFSPFYTNIEKLKLKGEQMIIKLNHQAGNIRAYINNNNL